MSDDEIYNRFNFGNEVVRLHELYQIKLNLHKQTEMIVRNIEDLRGQLPEEIVALYDKDRIVDQLK